MLLVRTDGPAVGRQVDLRIRSRGSKLNPSGVDALSRVSAHDRSPSRPALRLCAQHSPAPNSSSVPRACSTIASALASRTKSSNEIVAATDRRLSVCYPDEHHEKASPEPSLVHPHGRVRPRRVHLSGPCARAEARGAGRPNQAGRASCRRHAAAPRGCARRPDHPAQWQAAQIHSHGRHAAGRTARTARRPLTSSTRRIPLQAAIGR